MYPLTCYAGQISLCHAKIEKISKKIFVMINKDGGGGTIFGFYKGDTAVMRGDIELMGVPPVPLLGKPWSLPPKPAPTGIKAALNEQIK